MKRKEMEVKRIVVNTIIMTLALVVFNATSYANEVERKMQNDSTLQVQYLGQQNESPIIAIQINQSEETLFIITIKDVYGNWLYSEKIKDSSVNRTFVLNAEWFDIEGSSIEITNKSTNETSVYKVYGQLKNEYTTSIVKVGTNRL